MAGIVSRGGMAKGELHRFNFAMVLLLLACCLSLFDCVLTAC